jgi:hypothetical protein
MFSFLNNTPKVHISINPKDNKELSCQLFIADKIVRITD